VRVLLIAIISSSSFQSSQSDLVSTSLQVSKSGPPSPLSAVPAPPRRLSLPGSPKRVSSLAPPMRMSSPAPPHMTSSPPLPNISSLSMVLLGIFYIEGKETDDFIQG
jgi:hypothetical protein